MATAAIVLKTKQRLVNDEFSVTLRLTHGKTSKFYNISSLYLNDRYAFRCKKEDWIPASVEDNGLGRFRKTIPDFKAMNQILEDKLKFAREILESYDDDNSEFDFDRFEAALKKGRVSTSKQQGSITLQAYYNKLLTELEEQRKIGLYTIFTDAKSMLKKYKPDILLKDVNVPFLECFEGFLRHDRKNKDTTISVKMRNLQRVVNLAIDEGLFKRENYPFGEKKYSVNRRLNHKTKKRSVHIDVISKIKALPLNRPALELARDIFMFSFYTRGMNFIDIIGLTKASIINGEIYYVRSKTKQPFYIPLNSQAHELITKYQSDREYLFLKYSPELGQDFD